MADPTETKADVKATITASEDAPKGRKVPRLLAEELVRDSQERLGAEPYVVAAALASDDPEKRYSEAEAAKLVKTFLTTEVKTENLEA